MDEVIKALSSLLPFASWFEKLGIPATESDYLSVVLTALLLSLLWWKVSLLFSVQATTVESVYARRLLERRPDPGGLKAAVPAHCPVSGGSNPFISFRASAICFLKFIGVETTSPVCFS